MSNSNGNGRAASLEKTLDTLTKKYGEGTIMRLGEAHAHASRDDPDRIRCHWISPWALGVCHAGGSSRSMVPNLPARPPSASTSSPKLRDWGGLCAFIDMEHALDPVYAARCGVDVDNLYVSQPDTGSRRWKSPTP